MLRPGQADGRHSLAPDFLDWQTRRSVAELGRADIVFVHNPGTVGHDDRDRLQAELRSAFEVLEGLVASGVIGGYGVATLAGFTDDVFTVPELLTLARETGGPGHHLSAVQQPVSLGARAPVRCQDVSVPRVDALSWERVQGRDCVACGGRPSVDRVWRDAVNVHQDGYGLLFDSWCCPGSESR